MKDEHKILLAPDSSDEWRAESMIFRMNHKRFAFTMLRRYGRVWYIPAAVLVFLTLLIGLIFDMRFFIVAMMIQFIVIPFVMILFYDDYGLRRECVLNVLPHTVSVSGEKVRVAVCVSHKIEDLEEEQEREDIAFKENKEFNEDIEFKENREFNEYIEFRENREFNEDKGELEEHYHVEKEWKEWIYPREIFGKYHVGSDYVIFPFNKPLRGFLWIPVKAYADKESFISVVRGISGSE